MNAHSHPAPEISFTGRLERGAELRTLPIDKDGHSLPTLCLCLITATGRKMQIRKSYPDHASAQAMAQQLKKGAIITAGAPPECITLHAAASFLEVQTPAPSDATAHNPREPELAF